MPVQLHLTPHDQNFLTAMRIKTDEAPVAGNALWADIRESIPPVMEREDCGTETDSSEEDAHRAWMYLLYAVMAVGTSFIAGGVGVAAWSFWVEGR